MDMGISAGIQNAGNLGNGLLFADMNSDEADAARNFSASQQLQSQWFQRDMRSSAWQATVKDMQAAGINPMLAVSHGAANQTPGAGIGGTAQAHSNAPAFDYYGASAAELNSANAEKAKAEAKEIEARTPTHAVNIDKMKKDMDVADATIQKLAGETVHAYASAGQATQQTQNLKEAVPQIRAAVTQLRGLTALQDAQYDQVRKATDLTDEQIRNMQQVVKANLPKIEAHLKQLELPGRGMTAATNSSFLGAWRAVTRALAGQKD